MTWLLALGLTVIAKATDSSDTFRNTYRRIYRELKEA
jgi:hypothetical protein